MTEAVAVLAGVMAALLLVPLYGLAVDWISGWWIERDERRRDGR